MIYMSITWAVLNDVLYLSEKQYWIPYTQKDAGRQRVEIISSQDRNNKPNMGFAEESWGNKPYGNNEPYEPYESYKC